MRERLQLVFLGLLIAIGAAHLYVAENPTIIVMKEQGPQPEKQVCILFDRTWEHYDSPYFCGTRAAMNEVFRAMYCQGISTVASIARRNKESYMLIGDSLCPEQPTKVGK